MSLFSRRNVTLTPQPGLAPRPAADVRAALLALNRPDVRYAVRDGAAEGVDLVAEFQLVKLARKGVFGRVQDCEEYQVRMRLAAETSEVRAMDHHAEFTLTGEAPPRRRTQTSSRGQIHKKFVGYEFGHAPDGTRERHETYRFDTDDLKHALQQAALACGWTWQGLTGGKL